MKILGIEYEVEEVEVVNKTEPRLGEINYITNKILIDRSLPKDKKNQVLMHEIIHAICDLLGYDELGSDEEKVQGLATALHLVFSEQIIFSF